MSLITVELKRKQEFISFFFLFLFCFEFFFQDTLFHYFSLGIVEFPV